MRTPNSTIASRMQRIVMRVGHCALLLLVAGCAAPNAAKTPINAPLRPNPAVAGFRRVFVAGFVPSGSDEFKLNEETARFLRMELRSKASLQVIETEPLQLAVSPDARFKDSPGAKAADEVFANVRFWKRLGEEYSEPLILTGTVALTSLAPRYEEHQVGPRAVRVWRRGANLTLRLVFISGATGAIIDSAILPQQTAYATTSRERELSLFFQLMDRMMPSVLGIFGQQGNYVRAPQTR